MPPEQSPEQRAQHPAQSSFHLDKFVFTRAERRGESLSDKDALKICIMTGMNTSVTAMVNLGNLKADSVSAELDYVRHGPDAGVSVLGPRRVGDLVSPALTGSASWRYVAECGCEYANAWFDGQVSVG